jgi:Cu2+-exporting ATPase
MTTRLAGTARASCYHCGLPVETGDRYTLIVDGETKWLCCPACKTVAETIIAGGFGNYYRYRTETSARPDDNAEFALFDQPDFQQQWLRPHHDDFVEVELLIGGMHCAACTWLLENYLRRLPGIDAVHVNLGEQRAQIVFDREHIKLSDVCRAIADIGYQPQPYSSDRVDKLRRQENRVALRRLGVAGIGMMQVGMCAIGLYAGEIHGIEAVYRDFLRWISLLLTLPIIAYCGVSFFQGAWRGIRSAHPGMDLSVTLAIVLAFIASAIATVRGDGDVYFDSITMFIFLLLGSRYLEMRARHYNGQLGGDLLAMLPHSVTVLDVDNLPRSIPLAQLPTGATVLIGSGETVCADGELLDASASINEAALTGEFMPVHKQRGDALLAGSINGEQAVTMRVHSTGSTTRLSAIQRLSSQAAAHKPRIAQLADRLSSAFVVTIIALSAASWLFWHWRDPQRAFWIALAVLVVSCPCALGLATPVAITNATNTLRRRGLLVTKADIWEKLLTVTDIIFDKTGTLSEGRVRIAAQLTIGTRSLQVCRDIASALEAGSAHPIALAFKADHAIAPAEHRRQVAGCGVEGIIAGRTYRLGTLDFVAQLSQTEIVAPPSSGQWIVLGDQSGALCWFRLDDSPREDAASTVAALQQRGFKVHLLSGDQSDTVAQLAQALHINRVVAGATPEMKLAYVDKLQRDGARVLMVGDGINDIPVLAAANISLAMSNASQLAKTSADCIFLNSRLDGLLALLNGAAKTRRIIRENLGWALLYNLLAIPLAAAGWVPPYIAAIGMSLSSLLVVGNALRLNQFEKA